MPSAWLVRLARTLVGVFFRRIETVGAERVPLAGPLLVVANHHNSLVDPALLLARLPRPVRLLAKSTLWNMPALPLLLDGAAAIPVYRKQDEVDTARNEETFTACYEALAAGGCVALFPEGISHDAPRLAGLKTGAARIALEAGARFAPLGLRILPVGLVFDDKETFRSRALVRVGEPFVPDAEQALYAREPAEAVRALTRRIRAGLEGVTLNYPESEETSLFDRASEVWATSAATPLPERLALAEAFALRRNVIATYERLRDRYPEQVARARELAGRYESELHRLGLRDDHVAARYAPASVGAYLAGTLSLLLFWLPFAGLGIVLNYLPYRAVGFVADRGHSADLPATYKLLGGLVFFPIAWIAEALLAGLLIGPGIGLALLLLGPLTGYAAMRFQERYERLLDEAAAYLLRLVRRRRVRELRAERAALRSELDGLAALDRAAREKDDESDPDGRA